MVQHVEIEGEEYPFFFSMRAYFEFTKKQGLEFDEIGLPDYDVMLDLYENASKKGADKEDSDKALKADEIEDFIDEDPELFTELLELFYESKAFKALSENADEEELGKLKNKNE